MDVWPEFVIVEDRQSCLSNGGTGRIASPRTGWETVIFELGDQEPDSDFSTAAMAP